jgi:hypothetical protein
MVNSTLIIKWWSKSILDNKYTIWLINNYFLLFLTDSFIFFIFFRSLIPKYIDVISNIKIINNYTIKYWESLSIS